MTSFYYNDEVRELERKFTQEYEAYLNEQLSSAPTDAHAVHFLVRELTSNSAHWSGGYTLHNYEEQAKREIALDLLRRLSYKLIAKVAE